MTIPNSQLESNIDTLHIDNYSFGKIVIDGEPYTNDIIILPNRLIANWWRNKGHIFDLEDCAEIFAAGPELVIFGLGSFSRAKLSPALIRELEKKGMEYQASPTKTACASFNRKSSQLKTAAALHLTC